ncbi:hypothetical protein H2204_000803 [Knufia peltigerae]|uniref:Uncharacterized protein n=1 Tax=Knufia peltigerae TaxID=1002370 RepID=A0AA39D356_9EURO|nr:hypothetical protein H2204_000803 [Knufia peltigerae]
MSSTSGNVTYLPFRYCYDVSPQCPVENTIYGYYPNIGANCFFAAFFFVSSWSLAQSQSHIHAFSLVDGPDGGNQTKNPKTKQMAAALQLYAGIRYKTWTYLLAMFLGCIDQAIGYIGRVMLHNNPFDTAGFQIQICCLILGPAFNSAAIYLVLKHVTLCFGPEYSRIRPKRYTWIFITGDLISLVIQAVGGGMAATSMDNQSRQRVGDDLMMAGIAFQVATLSFFAVAALTYVIKRYRAPAPLPAEAKMFMASTKFRLFAMGLVVAFTCIFIRCVYRIVEMAGGWGNPIMQSEIPFIVLDGTMVTVATIVQTVLHPGWCFPRLSSGYVVPAADSHPGTFRDEEGELETLEKTKKDGNDTPDHNPEFS